jgi:hypothetical protein
MKSCPAQRGSVQQAIEAEKTQPDFHTLSFDQNDLGPSGKKFTQNPKPGFLLVTGTRV